MAYARLAIRNERYLDIAQQILPRAPVRGGSLVGARLLCTDGEADYACIEDQPGLQGPIEK